MKVAVDTNILVCSIVRDDAHQAQIADEILRHSDVVAIPLPCLCEFVWVLGTKYKFEQQSQWLGGETLVSLVWFDEKTLAILENCGIDAKLLA